MGVVRDVHGADSIAVYRGGEKTVCGRGSEGFAAVLAAWDETTARAVALPAFGVSIDRITRERMREGMWLEFVFPAKEYSEGYPFDRLLAELRGDFRGFNLIRHYMGGYDGRCIYLDLGGGKMAPLCEAAARIAAADGK